MELLEQVLWQEAEHRVLGGAHVVVGVAVVRVVGVGHGRGDAVVRDDGPVLGGRLGLVLPPEAEDLALVLRRILPKGVDGFRSRGLKRHNK